MNLELERPLINVAYIVQMMSYVASRRDRNKLRVETLHSAAVGHVAHGAQQKLSFLLNGCFNDGKKLNLGHEIKHWDGPQQVSTIESTSSTTPRWDITQLLNCEMCLSPQVNKDQNSIPGVRCSRAVCSLWKSVEMGLKQKKRRICTQRFVLVSETETYF